MDRRRAHEAFLDGRMYEIHGEDSVLANPIHFGPQFGGLRIDFKLFPTRDMRRSDLAVVTYFCVDTYLQSKNKTTIRGSITYSRLH